MSTYIQTLREQIKPQSNFIKFASGEKKVFIFRPDEEHIYKTESEYNGKRQERVRFIVTDVTDAMRPAEDRIWDASKRWAKIVLDYLDRNQECLEIERQGAGTDTQYYIMPATPTS